MEVNLNQLINDAQKAFDEEKDKRRKARNKRKALKRKLLTKK